MGGAWLRAKLSYELREAGHWLGASAMAVVVAERLTRNEERGEKRRKRRDSTTMDDRR